MIRGVRGGSSVSSPLTSRALRSLRTRCAATKAVTAAGRTQLVEKVTRRSYAQRSQRTRAKPWLRTYYDSSLAGPIIWLKRSC